MMPTNTARGSIKARQEPVNGFLSANLEGLREIVHGNGPSFPGAPITQNQVFDLSLLTCTPYTAEGKCGGKRSERRARSVPA